MFLHQTTLHRSMISTLINFCWWLRIRHIFAILYRQRHRWGAIQCCCIVSQAKQCRWRLVSVKTNVSEFYKLWKALISSEEQSNQIQAKKHLKQKRKNVKFSNESCFDSAVSLTPLNQFWIKYLGEFEVICKIALGYLCTRGDVRWKTGSSKISRGYPFQEKLEQMRKQEGTIGYWTRDRAEIL